MPTKRSFSIQNYVILKSCQHVYYINSIIIFFSSFSYFFYFYFFHFTHQQILSLMAFNDYLNNINGCRFFQMLPNIRGRDPKFETLGDKIKIIPNFKDANCNVVFYFIFLFIFFFEIRWHLMFTSLTDMDETMWALNLKFSFLLTQKKKKKNIRY
jgi:hypothetical protein